MTQFRPIDNGCKDCTEANKIIVSGWFLLQTAWQRAFKAELAATLMIMCVVAMNIATGLPIFAVLTTVAAIIMGLATKRSYTSWQRAKGLTKGFESFHQELLEAEKDHP